jgi:hypothetical protein
MLFKFNKIISNLNFDIKGIIHVGAGSGAELRDYKKLDVNNFIMIEPDPESYKKLILRKLFYSFFYSKKIYTENCLITDKVNKKPHFIF